MKTSVKFVCVHVAGLALALSLSLLAPSASATPYATCLTNNAGVVSFRLNEAADNVKVIGNAGTLTNDLGARGAGLTLTDLTGAGMTGGVFQVVVTKEGTGYAGYRSGVVNRISDESNLRTWFYLPTGVAVNNNPNSPYFGRVFVANGYAGTTTAPGSRTTGDGIYLLNADLSDAVGQGNTARTAGLVFNVEPTANSTYNRRVPWHLEVATNDLLYIADWSTNRGGIWVADMNMTTAYGLFETLYGLTNATVHTTCNGSVMVQGDLSSGDLTVWAIDGRWPGAGNRNRILRWDIGAGPLPWNSAPNAVGGTMYSSVDDVQSDLDRGPDGKFYGVCYRSAGTDVSSLKVFDTDATTELFGSLSAWGSPDPVRTIYCCKLTPDGRRLALLTDRGRTTFFVLTNGIPDFSTMTTLDTFANATASNGKDLTFDAAGNLYVVDNITERLRVFTPGGRSVAITTFDGTTGSFQLIRPAEVSVTATDPVASEEGLEPGTFTITRAGETSAPLTVNYTLSGTAVNGVDYQTLSGSVIIPANENSATVVVTPKSDSEREPVETVVLALAGGGLDYVILNPSSATVTILDNNLVLRYWDANGTDPGAGSPLTGTWGTDNYWNTVADGTGATVAWSDWSAAVFSAGDDGWDTFTVTLNGAQKADTLLFEEGTPTLAGSSLTLTNFSPVQVASGVTATINSVLAGGAGLWLEGPGGTLVLGGANTYSGPTTISSGTLQLGASERIPDESAVSLGATGVLDLGLNNETIGSLAGVAGATVTVYPGQTLTFGGNDADTTWNGTANSGGALVKVGAGTLTMTAGLIGDPLAISNGVVSINSPSRLGTANEIVLANGATLESTSAAVGGDFITPNRTITVGSGGGTLKVSSGSGILFVHDGSVISGAGTLTKDGPGEIRTYGVEHAFGKLVVKGGLYTAGHATSLGYNTSFGAIPTSVTSDAITLQNGGAIRKAGGQNVALDPKQGITLGAGGGVIRTYAGDVGTGTFEIPGSISGGGPLTLNATADLTPIMVLSGANTYSGGTIIPAGQVFVLNTSGSATGSGSVNVTNALLGGEGTLGGPVLMSGGNLSPGYSYNTGPVPVTPVTKAVAKLVLTNGLNLSLGATNTWQLGALSTGNPGVDFDQVELTGGSLTLGGSSALVIGFTGTATAPDTAEPFWQQSRQWKVISLSGSASNPGNSNFSAIRGTNGITAGTFTTTSDATGVTLVFTPSTVPPVAVTNMTIGPVSGGNVTINYSGGAGTQFVLLQSSSVTTPRSSWTRVATNPPGAVSFTIPVGSEARAFYCIQSE